MCAQETNPIHLLLDPLQQPEVQVVLVAVKVALIDGEYEVARVVMPPHHISQSDAVLLPAFKMVAGFVALVLLPGFEPATAGIQALVNLQHKKEVEETVTVVDSFLNSTQL